MLPRHQSIYERATNYCPDVVKWTVSASLAALFTSEALLVKEGIKDSSGCPGKLIILGISFLEV